MDFIWIKRGFAPDVKEIVALAPVMVSLASPAMLPNTSSMGSVLINVLPCFLWIQILMENVENVTGPVKNVWVPQWKTVWSAGRALYRREAVASLNVPQV